MQLLWIYQCHSYIQVQLQQVWSSFASQMFWLLTALEVDLYFLREFGMFSSLQYSKVVSDLIVLIGKYSKNPRIRT